MPAGVPVTTQVYSEASIPVQDQVIEWAGIPVQAQVPLYVEFF